MTVQQQIDTFIQGVKCATIQSIVVIIYGIACIRTGFDTYYNAIASKLELALALSTSVTQNKTRNVNQLNLNKNKIITKINPSQQRQT